MEQTLTQQAQMIDSLSEIIKNHELSMKQVSNEKEELNKKINNHHSEEEKLRSKVNLAEKESDDLKSNISDILNLLNSFKVSYKQIKLQDIPEMLKKLIEQSNQMKARHESMTKEIDSMRKEESETERRLKEIETVTSGKDKEDILSKERVKYLENEVKALKQELDQGEREKAILKKQNLRMETEFNVNKMRSFQFSSIKDDEKEKLREQLEYMQKIANDNVILTDNLEEKLKEVTQQKKTMENLLSQMVNDPSFKAKELIKLSDTQQQLITNLSKVEPKSSDDITIMEDRIRLKLDELKEKMSTIQTSMLNRSFRESRQLNLKDFSATLPN